MVILISLHCDLSSQLMFDEAKKLCERTERHDVMFGMILVLNKKLTVSEQLEFFN